MLRLSNEAKPCQGLTFQKWFAVCEISQGQKDTSLLSVTPVHRATFSISIGWRSPFASIIHSWSKFLRIWKSYAPTIFNTDPVFIKSEGFPVFHWWWRWEMGHLVSHSYSFVIWVIFFSFFYWRFPETSGIPVMLSVMGTVCQSKASAFPFLPRTVIQLLVDAIQSLSVISSLGRICFLSLTVFEEIIMSFK